MSEQEQPKHVINDRRKIRQEDLDYPFVEGEPDEVVRAKAEASLRRGIEQAEAGDLHDMGSFAEFLEEDEPAGYSGIQPAQEDEGEPCRVAFVIYQRPEDGKYVAINYDPKVTYAPAEMSTFSHMVQGCSEALHDLQIINTVQSMLNAQQQMAHQMQQQMQAQQMQQRLQAQNINIPRRG